MKRILIIDDDELIRRFLRDILGHEGYDVIDTDSGSEAMKFYREDPTDLIITDIVMPKMEGIEIVLKLVDEFPDVKIIAMSGGGAAGGTNVYLKNARQFGAVATLNKPFDVSELLAVIEKIWVN